jgi:phosphoglycolate phosphatase-like HAD superfamily hydrolase
MTLVDSSVGIAETLRVSLAEAGVTVTHEQTWPLVGIPLADTLLAVAPGVNVEAVSERYKELYPTTGVPVSRLLPGAREAVEAVHRAGGRVVVVSAKPAPVVREVLRHVGLEVDDVTGGLFGADKGIALLECHAGAYVGDHPGDLEAARAASAIAIGVATGPHDEAGLAAAGADVVLADLRDFPRWLAGWLSGRSRTGGP